MNRALKIPPPARKFDKGRRYDIVALLNFETFHGRDCGELLTLKEAKILTMMLLKRKMSAGIARSLSMFLILSSGAGAVEKLVDPSTVAPEYRAAAEKRRAEQDKLLACSKKAKEAKVPRRDRAGYINECLDK